MNEQQTAVGDTDPDTEHETNTDEISKLRNDFQVRLVALSLRTEAVKAGMIDLDCLKLIDTSGIRLADDDGIVDGRKIMDNFRRTKPWLFGPTSSSSTAVVPSTVPVRQKMALEMTDDEYKAARAAITKYQF